MMIINTHLALRISRTVHLHLRLRLCTIVCARGGNDQHPVAHRHVVEKRAILHCQASTRVSAPATTSLTWLLHIPAHAA